MSRRRLTGDDDRLPANATGCIEHDVEALDPCSFLSQINADPLAPGYEAGRQRGAGGSEIMMNDSTLRADIEAELEFEPSLDAANIGVAEKDGVCTLTGHVDSFFQKWAAEKAASRVKGVRAIAEQIEVRLPLSARQDPDQIALRAANVIAWNAMLPDDAVHVKVEKDWITLTGNVDWQYQKHAAEDGIRRLNGVAGITNLITISHHVATSDVRERITQAYKRSAEFDASKITIAVNDGKVTLSGQVKAWNERQIAETAVWNISGVTEVVDRLTVA